MNISAQIIKHSRHHSANSELVTFLLHYPRFIHAEFMTHRCFSRNASSSRAIPLEKMIGAVHHYPAEFEYFGINKKGMQAEDCLSKEDEMQFRDFWYALAQQACAGARAINDRWNLHKQMVNRALEPYSRITVVATAETRGLANFFALRAQKDAQPEFQVLAYKMLKAYKNSEPLILGKDDWHIPFDVECAENYVLGDRMKIATGRIARTSYLTHDGKRDISEDIRLHDQLRDSGHWSPFEHIAQSSSINARESNFGILWQQYRKLFPLECRPFSMSDKNEIQKHLDNRPEWINLD